MIDELRRFTIIVEQNSISKAAEKLFLTQPALTLSLHRLEHAIGKKLFKRTGKRLVLTKEGHSTYAIALQIIKLWGKTKQTLSTDKKIYAIGMYDNASLKLSQLLQNHLDTKYYRLEITIDRSEMLLQGMHHGIFDIAIAVLPKQLSLAKDITLIATITEPLIPVVKPQKTFKKSLPFILYNKSSETRRSIDETFFTSGIRPSVITESTSPAFMKELALGGFGIALLPKNFVEREIKLGKLRVHRLPYSFARRVGIFVADPKDAIVKALTKNITDRLTRTT